MKKSYQKYGNYDLTPMTKVAQDVKNPIIHGYNRIGERLLQDLSESTGPSNSQKSPILCDLYPGISEEEVIQGIAALKADVVIRTSELVWDEPTLNQIFADNLSEDRVFGTLSSKGIDACFNPERVEEARKSIADALAHGKIIVVIGVGASFVQPKGILIYFDITRWEIQLRYRAGASNWLWQSSECPILEKYKRGFFIEWRIADRHKLAVMEGIDYLIDVTIAEEPKMIPGTLFRASLEEVAQKPFRMQPYFDPGVWGGQWMKDVCGLDRSKENYAWSFDGVPEENSLNLSFSNGFLQIPAINLVLYRPKQLLGDKVHGRFGREFPIRFDLLDTMGGQNLSLQVHPLTEFIQEKFGMHYTQDESYYILDAEPGSVVYLGIKDGVDPEKMANSLRRAELGETPFPAEEFVNKIPVQPHDHVLIPAGTVHCSGANTMVLEISATPYIFTFKLWDWGRVGLDGLPRPIHLDYGLANIQWERTTRWVKDEIIHQEEVVAQNDYALRERTGLHRREFIETIRVTTDSMATIQMDDSVHMVNLVAGELGVVESVDGSFEPFEIHYAETAIIPASVGSYKIVSPKGASISLITAEVRG